MAVGGNTAYQQQDALPDLVAQAVAVATSLAFDNSCAPEQGRLLATLAGGRKGGRIGETGTGCGVGLAWMIDATDDSTSFVSVEIDDGRARAVADLLRDRRNVAIVHGD